MLDIGAGGERESEDLESNSCLHKSENIRKQRNVRFTVIVIIVYFHCVDLYVFSLYISTSLNFSYLWNCLDAGKVDILMNVVERPSGGFSAGGGLSCG